MGLLVIRIAAPVVGALLVLVACACGSSTETASKSSGFAVDASAGGEVRLRAVSESGRFQITIWPEGASIPLGQIHPWIVEVRSPNGEPIQLRQLVFDGGMPQHGHGFETKPQVTHVLGPGMFRVDGVRFHMAGAWKLRVDVASADAADLAYFDVEVGP